MLIDQTPRMVAHIGVPGPAPFIAMGLFFVGIGAAHAAYRLFKHPPAVLGRAPAIGLGVLACACFVLATTFPSSLARPTLGRPSTTARLEIMSPPEGAVFRGDPATIPVHLRLAAAPSSRSRPFAWCPTRGTSTCTSTAHSCR